jgi:hypothetical protein
MTLAKYLLLLLTFTSSLYAQQLSHPVISTRSGRDDAFSAPRVHVVLADTINVLAVMVQFQPDNDERTSGNGQFDLSTPADSIIDAPPRNRQYFRDHLTFLQNYYRKVSKGKAIIRTTVLDTVFTLPTVMATYSPPKNGSTIAVGNLARDTWQKVDSSGRVPNFSAYNCFVLFHAGVGRDVDLVGTLGYDPTPFDIPSLYLGLSAFREFYGGTYEGIPVGGGSFHITNTIVIPETENRLLPGVGGNFQLELSINGLLCASVGNHLGLPDLFDTNTGRSGIGRFGLMDGQAIFSFAGLFPPEPSAWEKYWLGWMEPIIVNAPGDSLTLPAVGIATANGDFSRQDTVYRVPITVSEYFLVENRNRDPLRNGQAITSTFNGVTRQQRFLHDTTHFNAFDISALAGVVTDVEDLDWSLPGGVDQSGTFFDGGVLIWHIDEAIIRQGLASNGVNADPERRGVDVEEADGSQDIGQQYGSISPGAGSEEGTALDFWYEGNNSPVNTNSFSPTSHPNSYSNAGANSHVSISSFSARGPRMSATIRVGDGSVTLLPGFPKSAGEILAKQSLTVGPLSTNSPPAVVVATTGQGVSQYRPSGSRLPRFPGAGKLYAWNASGGAAMPGGFSDGVMAAAAAGNSMQSGPALQDLNNDGVAELLLIEKAASNTGFACAFTARDQNADSLADSLFRVATNRSVNAVSPVLAESLFAFSDDQGKVYFVRFNGQVSDIVQNSADTTADIAGISRFVGVNAFIIASDDGTLRITTRSTSGGTAVPDVVRSFGRKIVGPAVTGLFGGVPRIAFATADGLLYLVDSNLNQIPGFPINTGGHITQPPAVADVDGDGQRDIIAFSGNKIYAYNYAGASLDNFPKQIPSLKPIRSNPVVADVDGDGDVDIVAVSEDGIVVAYDKNGSLVPGFPLQAGTGDQSVASFAYSPPPSQASQIGLAVASSDDGSISAWWTGVVGPVVQALRGSTWLQYQHDAQHTGLTIETIAGTPLSSDFFPTNRAYNWPNPVYEGKTFIRYFVKENATVNVKVFDLAGDLVKEFAGPGVGGVDNEVEWNVSGVQSGIYFARIEANGAGKNGVAIIKVAVVK